MKALKLSLGLAFLPAAAIAHPGHLIELGGHDHWIAGIALAGAAGAALWGALKGRKAGKSAELEPGSEPKGEAQKA